MNIHLYARVDKPPVSTTQLQVTATALINASKGEDGWSTVRIATPPPGSPAPDLDDLEEFQHAAKFNQPSIVGGKAALDVADVTGSGLDNETEAIEPSLLSNILQEHGPTTAHSPSELHSFNSPSLYDDAVQPNQPSAALLSSVEDFFAELSRLQALREPSKTADQEQRDPTHNGTTQHRRATPSQDRDWFPSHGLSGFLSLPASQLVDPLPALSRSASFTSLSPNLSFNPSSILSQSPSLSMSTNRRNPFIVSFYGEEYYTQNSEDSIYGPSSSRPGSAKKKGKQPAGGSQQSRLQSSLGKDSGVPSSYQEQPEGIPVAPPTQASPDSPPPGLCFASQPLPLPPPPPTMNASEEPVLEEANMTEPDKADVDVPDEVMAPQTPPGGGIRRSQDPVHSPTYYELYGTQPTQPGTPRLVFDPTPVFDLPDSDDEPSLSLPRAHAPQDPYEDARGEALAIRGPYDGSGNSHGPNVDSQGSQGSVPSAYRAGPLPSSGRSRAEELNEEQEVVEDLMDPTDMRYSSPPMVPSQNSNDDLYGPSPPMEGVQEDVRQEVVRQIAEFIPTQLETQLSHLPPSQGFVDSSESFPGLDPGRRILPPELTRPRTLPDVVMGNHEVPLPSGRPRSPEEDGERPRKRPRIERWEVLYRVIPHPHWLTLPVVKYQPPPSQSEYFPSQDSIFPHEPSQPEEETPREPDIQPWALQRLIDFPHSHGPTPIAVAPYTLESANEFLTDNFGRATWVIPIRGRPPFPGCTPASITDDAENPDECFPAGPISTGSFQDEPGAITWTPASLRAMWEFLCERRREMKMGLMGISFEVARPAHVRLRGVKSAADEGGVLEGVDHFRVHVDARWAVHLRAMLHLWRYRCPLPPHLEAAAQRAIQHDIETYGERKREDGVSARMFRGARLVLLDPRDRAIMTC